MTGLRGVAALLVLGFHCHYIGTALAAFMSALFGAGYIGVDLFFVLSGYVIARNYLGSTLRPLTTTFGEYLTKRLARVYPLHVFVLLVLFVSVALDVSMVPGGKQSTGELVRALLLMNAWGPQLTFAWNGPSWSISAELMAYVLFPLLAIVVLRIDRALTSVLLCALLYAILYHVSWFYSSADVSVVAARIFCEFSAGVLLYRAQRIGLPTISTTWAVPCTLIAFIVGGSLNDYTTKLAAPGGLP